MRYLNIPLLALAALILSTRTASADIGDQLVKLLPKDGTEYDLFGRSVAIKSDTIIVGAFYGNPGGSAYIFNTTGEQITKLLPDDGVPTDNFGGAVAITGSSGYEIAIVGARYHDDNGTDSGAAYLFDSAGKQIAKLLANDGEPIDNFGLAVAITGTPGKEIAIIGAPGDSENGVWSGSAYLFDVTTGKQIAKLLPIDGDGSDLFGASVAINSTTAIVGAWQYGDKDYGYSGTVYVFDTATGKQINQLLPNDGASDDFFGRSIAICGNIAIVGAPGDDDFGQSSGSAYLFDISTGQQITKLLPEDGSVIDVFGYSVGICGSPGDEVAVVGARGDAVNGTQSGSAYLFDATGQQLAKLLPDDGETYDHFGISVAISGCTAVIGAYGDDDNGSGSGSAYIFDATTIALCPWDLDDSGAVGTGDLLELFTQWGTAGSADFDESGTVGTGDLLILFANWGPCK